MQAEARTGAAVKAVLDQLAEVYVTRDLELMATVFAPDPDVVMFSPGSKERFVGLAEIQAKAESDWSRSDAASLAYRRTSVSATGSIAWAAVDADFTVTANGLTTTMPVHITFVLERREERWLIVHAHYSLP
jgi:uncharacterized protein (TIGR02246 family)